MYDNEDSNVQYVRSNTENLQDLEYDNTFDYYQVTSHQFNYTPNDKLDFNTLQELIKQGRVPDGHPVYVKKKGGKRVLKRGRRVLGGDRTFEDFLKLVADNILIENSPNSDDYLQKKIKTVKDIIKEFIETKQLETRNWSGFFSGTKNKYFENILTALCDFLLKKIKFYNSSGNASNYEFIESDLKPLLKNYYDWLLKPDTDPDILEFKKSMSTIPYIKDSALSIELGAKIEKYRQDNDIVPTVSSWFGTSTDFNSFKDKLIEFIFTAKLYKIDINSDDTTIDRYFKSFIQTFSKLSYEEVSKMILMALLYLINTQYNFPIASIGDNIEVLAIIKNIIEPIDKKIKKYYKWLQKSDDDEELGYIQDVLDNGNFTNEQKIDEIREIIELNTVHSIMDTIQNKRNAYERDIVEFSHNADKLLDHNIKYAEDYKGNIDYSSKGDSDDNSDSDMPQLDSDMLQLDSDMPQLDIDSDDEPNKSQISTNTKEKLVFSPLYLNTMKHIANNTLVGTGHHTIYSDGYKPPLNDSDDESDSDDEK